jgi:hypothetical protein
MRCFGTQTSPKIQVHIFLAKAETGGPYSTEAARQPVPLLRGPYAGDSLIPRHGLLLFVFFLSETRTEGEREPKRTGEKKSNQSIKKRIREGSLSLSCPGEKRGKRGAGRGCRDGSGRVHAADLHTRIHRQGASATPLRGMKVSVVRFFRLAADSFYFFSVFRFHLDRIATARK